MSHSPIDEGQFVGIHGLEQWVTIRGQDPGNPVVLIIPGPGGGMSVMAPFFAAWERDFTLVQWDQPRAGVTDARHGAQAIADFSMSRLTRDAVAIVEFVRHYLGVRKVALLALSAGTIVGLRVVKQRADLISAYIATGQVVNWARQDALSYSIVLADARAAQNHAAVIELEQIGAPPYADTATDAIKSKYSVALSPAEAQAFAFLRDMRAPPREARYVPTEAMPDPDARSVSMRAYDALRAEIHAFDAESLGLDFHAPMFFLQGEADACTVPSEIKTYAAKIRAPRSTFVSIEGGGHSPWLMRDRFLELLRTHVRPVL